MVFSFELFPTFKDYEGELIENEITTPDDLFPLGIEPFAWTFPCAFYIKPDVSDPGLIPFANSVALFEKISDISYVVKQMKPQPNNKIVVESNSATYIYLKYGGWTPINEVQNSLVYQTLGGNNFLTEDSTIIVGGYKVEYPRYSFCFFKPNSLNPNNFLGLYGRNNLTSLKFNNSILITDYDIVKNDITPNAVLNLLVFSDVKASLPYDTFGNQAGSGKLNLFVDANDPIQLRLEGATVANPIATFYYHKIV